MASWEEPTGETPVVDEAPPRRRRSPVDQAITTLLVGAVVVTVAVGAFIFGRSRTDSGITNSSTASSVAVVADSSTSTSTTRRGKFDTTMPADSAAPADAAASNGSPTSAPAASTTAPAPTTTAPATTQSTAPPTTTADTTP
jgi:hypothetical protein